MIWKSVSWRVQNLICAPINPIVAAVLNVARSLLVVFNSGRLVRAGEQLEHFVTEGSTTAPA